jgi:DNA-sulfur modification-associated
MSSKNFNWDDIESFGHKISGQKVDEHRFVTTMKFERLENLVKNPLNAINPKLRENEAGLEEYNELHEKIQRGFDPGRRKNVEDYANYIISISKGEFGDTPTIDLFTPELLPVKDGGSKERDVLAWPYSLPCVPYDGETQLAARFVAAGKDKVTRSQPVIVTITHGKPTKHAMQCFGDRNAKQRRASSSITMKMNTRDPFVNIVREIESSVPGFDHAVEWEGRQPKDGKIATASSIRTAVACFAAGISGVQSKNEALPPGLSEEEFERRALLWFGKILPGLLQGMKDKVNYVTGSPAIWAGLGAMGHKLATLPQGDVETMATGLASRLSSVRWGKSDNWVGIAIKPTATGYSFAGGAKDSGSAAFRALTDESDPNYQKIRSESPSESRLLRQLR